MPDCRIPTRCTTSWKRCCADDRKRAIASSRSRQRCPSSPQSRSRVVADDADVTNARVNVRAVLWDLDGTLTDSVRFVVDTANRVIEAHGGSALDFDSVGAMTGLPLEEIFRIAWPDLTPEDAQAYRHEYRDVYDREVVPA